MVIRQVTEQEYEKVHEMQCVYLDVEDRDAFRKRVAENPDLYLAAWDGEELLGMCYGKIKPAGNAVLSGICVDLDNHARMGVGSALLRELERILLRRGLCEYSVGSADDPKVERFYLKNGFQPIELVAWDKDGKKYIQEEVSSYEEGQRLRDQLSEKMGHREGIFIFRKELEKKSV